MIRLVERRYVGTWRDTTYERDDGSQFRVAVPAMVGAAAYAEHDHYECEYDESAEASMMLSLSPIADGPQAAEDASIWK